MSRVRTGFVMGAASALVVLLGGSCTNNNCLPVQQGPPSPSARHFAPTPSKWIETTVDVFPGMDGVTLDPNAESDPAKKEAVRQALRGRIVWNIWVGDSGLMWDWLSQHGFGTADLLKTVDSRRHNSRFYDIGIINQPGYMESTKPDKYGLFLDVPNPSDPAGGIDQIVDTYTYGRSSGVVGLRLSDNPAFDDNAKRAWMSHVGPDGVNHDFYDTPSYYEDKNLVRPYIVGMACSLSHVSFDPVRPPADVNNPKWENLNDYIGAQYFNVTEFFVPQHVHGGNGTPVTVDAPDESSFVWQLINTSRSGALDTSFIATDYLNNPGTMNGVFNVGQRLSRAAQGITTPSGGDPQKEQLTGGALWLKWLNVDHGQLVPRVLKQGDDSVGFEGALSRVYVNIGHAWPQWQQHFRPLVGGPMLSGACLVSQTPVTLKEMQENSPSWNWSEDRSHDLALYFINYAKPLLLKNAPGGSKYLTADQATLDRGKRVFAENCAACHSSKQPDAFPFDASGRITEQAKSWFRTAVMQPDFFSDNFLSDERRHPVTQIGTNATRAAATYATRYHIWDNFSSETYKNLPAIGSFTVSNPADFGGQTTITIPYPGDPNGPGYYRPPSLISLWSSAPFLHNNAVGVDPTRDPNLRGKVDTDARMAAFDDGIRQMLWMTAAPRGQQIWMTTQKSWIYVPMNYLPDALRDLINTRHKSLVLNDNLKIGPIPRGTPINLIANTNLDPGLGNAWKRLKLVDKVLDVLEEIKDKNDVEAAQIMKEKLVPQFLALNKCPDFYEDKGHEFGRSLSNDDKLALIELLKTF
jgi:hypothetical protein